MLDKLDRATRPIQHLIAFALGLLLDELAQWRYRRAWRRKIALGA